jgi:hypothetical protein
VGNRGLQLVQTVAHPSRTATEPNRTGLNCYFYSKYFLFYELITLQERKKEKKKLYEAQTTMSVVWAVWVHSFGSEPGSVDVAGVVAEAW